jgi:hypothetical protein
MISMTDPSGRILCFLDRADIIFNCELMSVARYDNISIQLKRLLNQYLVNNITSPAEFMHPDRVVLKRCQFITQYM